MYYRLEFTFQPVIFLLSLPMAARETGHGAEMGRAFPMGAVPESASKIEASKRDTLSATPPSGKCIPESRLGTGHSFPTDAVSENASRNFASKRAAVSQRPSKRKLHPGIRLQSGTRFPVEPRLGNSVPFPVKAGGSDTLRTARLACYVDASSPLRNTRLRCLRWKERSCCKPCWALRR